MRGRTTLGRNPIGPQAGANGRHLRDGSGSLDDLSAKMRGRAHADRRNRRSFPTARKTPVGLGGLTRLYRTRQALIESSERLHCREVGVRLPLKSPRLNSRSAPDTEDFKAYPPRCKRRVDLRDEAPMALHRKEYELILLVAFTGYLQTGVPWHEKFRRFVFWFDADRRHDRLQEGRDPAGRRSRHRRDRSGR